MKENDLVYHSLTERIGIVIRAGEPAFGCPGAIYVVWTTQGLSLFGPGSKEWCSRSQLELLSECR